MKLFCANREDVMCELKRRSVPGNCTNSARIANDIVLITPNIIQA